MGEPAADNESNIHITVLRSESSDAVLMAGLKMWRQASLHAVEGGILPPGKKLRRAKRFELTKGLIRSHAAPPGWKPRLHVSQDGRRHLY